MRSLSNEQRWVWMDLEMTGLDPEKEVILEIATVITDGDLNIIAEGPNLVVHQPQSILENMDAWCVQHHGDSGLTAKVQSSNISVAEAEQITLAFIRQHVDARKSPLCGNSIHQDRRFLVRYMPELEAHLHYRNIDVSTVKELVKSWQPDANRYVKKGEHLALADIQESIAELRFYRECYFNI
ncbi:MAG: oligoribonuclease [Zetaproteobacteria bacterium]|nr:oligoribonuclease [Zetaproteobacteria bacterium]